jgi:transmembrane sensor
MKPRSDELSVALEALRNSPVVIESRNYARRWERARARRASLRGVMFGPTGAIAAACVTVCIAIVALPRAVKQPTSNLIETGTTATRTLALDDGSRIVLDRNSRLRVAFTNSDRDVELLDGQARFEAAKDAHRPFRVRTKSAEVVAIGTMFDVATLPMRTTVTLIEGRVNVRTITGTPQGESRVEALTPGQQLGITGDGQLLDKKMVQVENVTAWQRGTIVIDDAPLPEALAAMNHYSMTHIVVLDPTLQSRRVSGTFRIGDVETETIALRRYFGLHETSRSGREIVLERD